MRMPKNSLFLYPVVCLGLLLGACSSTKTDSDGRAGSNSTADKPTSGSTAETQKPTTTPTNPLPAKNVAAGAVDVASLVSVESGSGPAVNGKLAPNFSWKGSDGVVRSLSDYKGKVVLVNFWGTWCPPCRRELPDIVKLRDEMKGKMEVIGVCLERVENPAPHVAKFAQANGLLYPLVIADESVVNAYGGINGVPTTFIVNTKGEITESMVGMRDEATFRKSIEKAM